MVTCIVPFIFFSIMIGCGVLVNMYLYTHGMFQGRSSGRLDDWDESYFSTDMSGRHDITGSYVRKGLLLAVAAILLACVVMVTLLVPLWH